MTDSQLPDVVPLEYGGKWIAWTPDALHIAGVGDTPQAAQLAAEEAGIAEGIVEWVPPADEGFIGGTP
ncbi:MAG: hypothetical protein JNG90_05145 [Planctomycetaceae bacterium]|nr:hypothetical protein [Planctomycetaceae bacterium]